MHHLYFYNIINLNLNYLNDIIQCSFYGYSEKFITFFIMLIKNLKTTERSRARSASNNNKPEISPLRCTSEMEHTSILFAHIIKHTNKRQNSCYNLLATKNFIIEINLYKNLLEKKLPYHY